jgi:hypothetical protein
VKVRAAASWTAALALAACQIAAPTPPATDAAAGYRQAIGSMIAADGPAAVALLRALPPQGLSDPQRSTRDCIVARFGPGANGAAAGDAVALSPTAAAVLAAYRSYWSAMLMHRAPQPQAEQALREALQRQTGLASPDLAAQTEAARALVERQGLHALAGVTAPLHELMVWRKQTSRSETVLLPEQSIDVTVTLLDDFVSLGWLAHATCDRHHTGGWATREGLMVVAPSWDLSSEDYRVSLLAHEAQHFADIRRFPKLGSADLEYRAKLVELILAEQTQRELLLDFAAQAQPERASAHAYASHWLMKHLRARLATDDLAAVAPATLREAARALLHEHTQALSARGASAVETALP